MALRILRRRGIPLALAFLLAGCFSDSAELDRQEAEDRLAARAASQARVDGVLRVNDAPMSFEGCSTGDRSGFQGVELKGKDGGRLRLVHEADGSWSVIGMPVRADAITMKDCGKIALDRLWWRGEGDTARGVARL